MIGLYVISIRELDYNRRYDKTNLLTRKLYALVTSTTLTHVPYLPISHTRVSILKYRTCDITPPYITCTKCVESNI